jgi:hypothetical protein
MFLSIKHSKFECLPKSKEEEEHAFTETIKVGILRRMKWWRTTCPIIKGLAVLVQVRVANGSILTYS